MVIPFGYPAISTQYKQGIAFCRAGPEGSAVFDLEGRVILPEEKLCHTWLLNDSTGAVQDFRQEAVRTYDLPGRPCNTWPYSHMSQSASGRIRATRISRVGTGIVALEGLTDPDGKVLIPIAFTGIAWEQGDWARVVHDKQGMAGIFQISTQTLYPDNFHQVRPPDPPGNSAYWKGPSWEQARAGLMDAQFKVIIPPTFADIRYLDEKGHHILPVGRSNRGDLYGLGHTEGKVRIDTMLLGFEPMVRKRATGPYDRRQAVMKNDTLPFLVFEDALSGKKGLWHHQAGKLRAAAFDRFEGVSPVTFIRKKGIPLSCSTLTAARWPAPVTGSTRKWWMATWSSARPDRTNTSCRTRKAASSASSRASHVGWPTMCM